MHKVESETTTLASVFTFFNEIEIEQGLTSQQTHYRSYRRRFLQVI